LVAPSFQEARAVTSALRSPPLPSSRAPGRS
jgi:hypothetical protein